AWSRRALAADGQRRRPPAVSPRADPSGLRVARLDRRFHEAARTRLLSGSYAIPRDPVVLKPSPLVRAAVRQPRRDGDRDADCAVSPSIIRWFLDNNSPEE